MSDQDRDAFDGDLFNDWLGEIKPGGKVSGLTGQLRYRQGSDGVDWSAAGAQKYLPHEWHMQVGAAYDMFTSRNSGGFEITFPTPFAEPPIVLVTIAATLPLFEQVDIQAPIQSASVCEVYWWSVNNITRIYVNWLAFGPIGL
jgi:hypothetical protein